MSDTDLELLARYARHRAEDAFAEIVRRHLDLVHSAALRQVRSPQLAEEVAQSTFLKLAQHARQLAPGTVLSAWLYQVTRRESIDVVRREARRQMREQIATEMNAMNATAADWTHIEPLLDDAMAALDETDRTAVLLRYFENKSLREVGEVLGASENAAQKRLTRAVERLREFLAQRGVTVGASGLAVVISANAVQAAPIGMVATISSAATTALAGTTVLTTTTATVGNAIAMTTMQKVLIGVAAVLVLTVGTTITLMVREGNNAPQTTSLAPAPVVSALSEPKAVADEKEDDSWRSASLTWQQVGQTAPQVKILPTKFQPPVTRMLTSDGIKRGGINVSVREILWAAYRCSPGRMAFTAGEPQEKYDFISTLPLGTEAALQGEVKKTLRLTGRWENLETNVLALKVRTPDAPGLKPATRRPSEFGNLVRGHIHCFGQPLSWNPPMPPWGLTKQLERIFQIPIVDETGLKGSYDLDLRWRVETDQSANQEAVKRALIEQLGLELVPEHKAVGILIVEKVQ